MTTMAYIIAGLCVLLVVAGMIWYALMVRGGDENNRVAAETDTAKEEKAGAGGNSTEKEESGAVRFEKQEGND